jgi:hypothetical protein
MSGGKSLKQLGNIAIVGAMVGTTAPAVADTAMTAGTLVERLPVSERYTYVAGVIDGLAYARFQKDTAAAGEKAEDGMICIYDWFYKGENTFETIDTAFKTYGEHLPSTLVATLAQRECGD